MLLLDSEFIDKLLYIMKHKLFILNDRNELFNTSSNFHTVIYKNTDREEMSSTLINIKHFLVLESRRRRVYKLKSFCLTKYVNDICCAVYSGRYIEKSEYTGTKCGIDDRRVKDIWKLLDHKDTVRTVVSKYFNTRPIVFSCYYRYMMKLDLPEEIIHHIMSFI